MRLLKDMLSYVYVYAKSCAMRSVLVHLVVRGQEVLFVRCDVIKNSFLAQSAFALLHELVVSLIMSYQQKKRQHVHKEVAFVLQSLVGNYYYQQLEFLN